MEGFDASGSGAITALIDQWPAIDLFGFEKSDGLQPAEEAAPYPTKIVDSVSCSDITVLDETL